MPCDDPHCSELFAHPEETAHAGQADATLLVEIDEALILDCAGGPQPLARLAALGMKAFGSELPGLSCHFYALRALALVDSGAMELVGAKASLSSTFLRKAR